MLGTDAIDTIEQRRDEFFKPRSLGLRSHVVLRSRFAEDRLETAVARGIRQYVMLGAGGDTFAYRQPSWARELHIVEVDQSASQAEKRFRLRWASVDAPDNLTFAPIDFETTTLADGLSAAGVDSSVPTFFSWLGVTMYLTEPAIDAVLRTVVRFPPSSEIVLTFAPRATGEDQMDQGGGLAERAAELGEPWLTYFDPPELDAKLRSIGFSDVYFLTPTIARERYFAGRPDGLPVPRRTSIASAMV